MLHMLHRSSRDARPIVPSLLLAIAAGPLCAADAPPGVPTDINATANSIPDHGSIGAGVGLTVKSVDPDGDPVTYSLPGNAGGQFAINPVSGVVTVAGVVALGDGATRTILARATAKGLTADQTFVINVTANTHAPVVTVPLPRRSDQSFALLLDATVADSDSLRGVKTTWNVASGPGEVLFANPDAVDTTATFSVDGVYFLRLTATDGIATVSKTVEVIVDLPGLVTVDNGMAGTAMNGSWKLSSNVTGIGGSTTYIAAESNTQMTWALPTGPGWYELQVYAPVNANARSAQVYTVSHAGGTTDRTSDLTTGPAGWRSLGYYRSGENGFSIATGGIKARVDAVRAIALPGLIVDNGTPGYSSQGGPWYTAAAGGLNGSSVRFTSSSEASASWAFPAAGPGHVFFNLITAASNAEGWSASVTSATGTAQIGLSASEGGSRWIDFGSFQFTDGGTVSLHGEGGGILRADAVRLALDTVLDNGMIGYSESGGGWVSGPNIGLGGSTTRMSAAAGAAARWRVPLAPGRYRAWAYRTVSLQSATQVDWQVAHDGGVSVTSAGQIGGDPGWLDLGTFDFTTGIGQIRALRVGSGKLNADVVRFEPVAETPQVVLLDGPG